MHQVNSVGAEVLEFISDFGRPSAPSPAAIVACVPKKMHVEGIGETEFKIEPKEILSAIEAGLKQPIEAEPEVCTWKQVIWGTTILPSEIVFNLKKYFIFSY